MIRTLLIEDNPFVIKNLGSLINATNANIEIIGSITNAYDVIPFIEKNEVDLIFMDIDLGCELDGVELVKKISNIQNDIIFIYATAHTERSYDCWKTPSITLGLLDKPFDSNELKLILKKVTKYIEKERIIIKDRDNKLYYLNPNSIIFVEKCNKQKNSIIYYKDIQIDTLEPLFEIEKKLKRLSQLIKSHKSFIINTSKIFQLLPESESSYCVIFQNDFPHKALITKVKAKELGLVS